MMGSMLMLRRGVQFLEKDVLRFWDAWCKRVAFLGISHSNTSRKANVQLQGYVAHNASK
jgi:hypothetical protein